LLNGFINEAGILKEKIKGLVVPDKCALEELVAKESELKGRLFSSQNSINELNNNTKKFNNLTGKCPLCHQEISKEHSSRFKKEALARINELIASKKDLMSSLKALNNNIKKEREKKRLIDSFKIKKDRINELQEKISILKKELINVKAGRLESLKKEFLKINKLFINSSSNNKVLKEKKRNIDNNINRLKCGLEELRDELKQLINYKNKSLILDKKIKLLDKLRNDIRGIRNVVRTRFLEDFRHEFQKKYENLRQDDVYSVEINNNYAPIAFAGRDETSINALSGGEKTSVALAYRLALSDIAARVSSVEQGELLLLDEPTTGFDRRDISVLPKALRAIKSIPQIIIISHEEELKEAADIKFELHKKSNTTIINELLQ